MSINNVLAGVASPLKRCAVLIGVLVVCSTAFAHEMRPALLRFEQQDLTTWQMVFKQPQVNGRFLNLRAVTDCQSSEAESIVGQTALQETFILECPAGGPTVVQIQGIENTLVDTMVSLDSLDGTRTNHLITASASVLNLGDDAPSVPAYLVLGVEHLVFGIDHVLFVLVLLYLVKGWVNILKVVTSFTVAHSVTLALSAFDLVSVSQAPVEALIALSIVLLAAESLRDGDSVMASNPWLVTFVFGLLHGLGFAGALADIGLPEDSAVWALFLFNVGIELGQIAIVVAALVLVYGLSKTSLRPGPVMTTLPLYAIGGLASYWFIERTVMVLVA